MEADLTDASKSMTWSAASISGPSAPLRSRTLIFFLFEVVARAWLGFKCPALILSELESLESDALNYSLQGLGKTTMSGGGKLKCAG